MFKEFFQSIVLEKPQSYLSITLFPITFDNTEGYLQYMSIAEALKKEFITITEINESGSVPDLKVLNKAPVPVLILDGEEVKGAKQNRVVNTSILIPEESEIIIPVTCTERGRWSYNSPQFKSSDNLMPRDLRTKLHDSVSFSMASCEIPKSNQSMVWNDIEKLHFRSGTDSTSRTRAMDDVFRKKELALKEAMGYFKPVPGQTGFLVIYNRKVAGLEYISNPAVYASLHDKLVKSYILERVEEQALDQPESTDVKWMRANEFIILCKDLEYTKYPSVGYGFDFRFMSDERSGSILMHEEEVIHAVFANKNPS